MNPPIFLWQPDDLIVFESALIAERFVEGDTEGDLFDSEGRRLRFDVVEEVRKHPYVVLALRSGEDEPTHQGGAHGRSEAGSQGERRSGRTRSSVSGGSSRQGGRPLRIRSLGVPAVGRLAGGRLRARVRS